MMLTLMSSHSNIISRVCCRRHCHYRHYLRSCLSTAANPSQQEVKPTLPSPLPPTLHHRRRHHHHRHYQNGRGFTSCCGETAALTGIANTKNEPCRIRNLNRQRAFASTTARSSDIAPTLRDYYDGSGGDGRCCRTSRINSSGSVDPGTVSKQVLPESVSKVLLPNAISTPSSWSSLLMNQRLDSSVDPPPVPPVVTPAPTDKEEEDPVEEEEMKKKAAAAAKVQEAPPPVRPLFPWKHEDFFKMPRIVPGTPEFLNDIVLSLRAQSIIAHAFLDVSALRCLFAETQWRQELADAATYAFMQAVTGIVASSYEVPIDDISIYNENNNKSKIDFVFPPSSETSSSSQNDSTTTTTTTTKAGRTASNQTKTVKKKKKKKTRHFIRATRTMSQRANTTRRKLKGMPRPMKTKTTTLQKARRRSRQGMLTKRKKVVKQQPEAAAAAAPETGDKDDNVDSYPKVEAMMSDALCKLYKSAAASGKDQLQIRLQVEPKVSYLYSVFALPYVTRQACQRDPKLLRKVHDIMRLTRGNPREAMRKIMQHVTDTVDGGGKLESTVEIQVLVICDEIFQVVDKATGQVLQGNPVAGKVDQQIAHLVCLESTVETVVDEGSDGSWFPSLPYNRMSSDWVITNWDDLLGSDKWYKNIVSSSK